MSSSIAYTKPSATKVGDVDALLKTNSLSTKFQHVNGISKMTPLASGFKPGRFDVICARGKAALKHTGNIRFRKLIDMHLENYSTAETKPAKSAIVTSITKAIREASPGGGFVRQIKGFWYEVGDHIAREKIGQSFRDALHDKYRSSTRAKLIRKKISEGKPIPKYDSTKNNKVAKIIKEASVVTDEIGSGSVLAFSGNKSSNQTSCLQISINEEGNPNVLPKKEEDSRNFLPMKEAQHFLPMKEAQHFLPMKEAQHFLPMKEAQHCLPMKEAKQYFPSPEPINYISALRMDHASRMQDRIRSSLQGVPQQPINLTDMFFEESLEVPDFEISTSIFDDEHVVDAFTGSGIENDGACHFDDERFSLGNFSLVNP